MPKTMETNHAEEKKNGEDSRSVEEVFAELDRLAEGLEDPKTSLEDSFRMYQQGMELLKYCSGRLDMVEKKMLQLKEDGSFLEFSPDR